MNCKNRFRLVFSIFLVAGSVFGIYRAHAQEWPGIRDSVFSDVLNETRIIQVVMPEGYSKEKDSRYEVMYVLDGEWYMEQIPFIYNFTVSAGFAPENIFVLIPNTYKNGVNLRDRDFSPTKTDDDPSSGGAENFHTFLKKELIPYVEKKYSANGRRTLVGSSFSGLFSVYAFVKDPDLFQSYVASDPNLNWDNYFVPNLAAERLPSFGEVESTLFVAGLEKTSAVMGGRMLDSVFTTLAPESLHWKYMEYKNETHYSVQHKAFYDGFRYSHEGFDSGPLEFHPMNGIVLPGKSLRLFIPDEIPTARYTTDGTEPLPSSPLLKNRSAAIPGPSILKVKTFPNRKSEIREASGTFTEGKAMQPGSRTGNINAGLYYSVFEGDLDSIPDMINKIPVDSGVVDNAFRINRISTGKDVALLIEGGLQVPESGYYIFGTNASDGSILYLQGRVVLETDPGNPVVRSFVLPLKEGIYPFRLELLHKKGSPGIDYYIFHAAGENDNWWENPIRMF